MNINDIRKTFISYFEGKSHKAGTSAPMVVKNDPTLMFTNAGMVPFKEFFLGQKKVVTPVFLILKNVYVFLGNIMI